EASPKGSDEGEPRRAGHGRPRLRPRPGRSGRPGCPCDGSGRMAHQARHRDEDRPLRRNAPPLRRRPPGAGGGPVHDHPGAAYLRWADGGRRASRAAGPLTPVAIAEDEAAVSEGPTDASSDNVNDAAVSQSAATRAGVAQNLIVCTGASPSIPKQPTFKSDKSNM